MQDVLRIVSPTLSSVPLGINQPDHRLSLFHPTRQTNTLQVSLVRRRRERKKKSKSELCPCSLLVLCESSCGSKLDRRRSLTILVPFWFSGATMDLMQSF